MHSILAVDDSASMRKMVSFTLTGAGYHVVEAVDGQDGFEKAQANHIDLVLTDQNMPRLDGLGLTRKLAASMPPAARRPALPTRRSRPAAAAGAANSLAELPGRVELELDTP